MEFANEHGDEPADWKPTAADFTSFKTYLEGRENIDEYLGVFHLAMSDSLLDANRTYLERGLRREVARRLHGPQAAYRVAIEADTQLHETLDLFKQAKTLPEMFALAAKWNEEHLQQLAAEDAARSRPKTTAN